MHVGQEHRRPAGVAHDLLGGDDPEQDVGGEDRDDDDEGGGGDDPSTAAAVEGEEAGAAGGRSFPQEQAGDDVARDDEEDVDADVPPEMGDADVVEHDEEHGHGPQALDIGSKGPVLGGRPRLVTRRQEPGRGSRARRVLAGRVGLRHRRADPHGRKGSAGVPRPGDTLIGSSANSTGRPLLPAVTWDVAASAGRAPGGDDQWNGNWP